MTDASPHFDWTIVGAGPTGIAALGKLLDNSVDPARIAWIDPFFQVGDFGQKWSQVPSNTKVNLFTKFLHACPSFEYKNCPENFPLDTLPPDDTCQLDHMVRPLQWITSLLRKKVTSYEQTVSRLKLIDRKWKISLSSTQHIMSKNIVLAIGADEKKLTHSQVQTVPLEIALNCEKLNKTCTKNDTVAVFGSSHSAILAIRNLLETTSVKKIINFYLEPLRYAVYMGNTTDAIQAPIILFDNTGLKGSTADWARENLHGKEIEKLERVLATNENQQKYIKLCTQAIYAIGFEKRHIPIVDLQHISYNNKLGIIAPGLFGAGIAFPEEKTDQFGITEYRVGLWKFMEYLTKVVPIWLKYHP